jgi:hypothetical protein
MSAAGWSWLLAIVGTVASIAGVVFSWLAWVQAGKAKDAARDAANAVRRRNFALDAMRLADDAREFLLAVQQYRFENALSLANGLNHGLGLLRSQGFGDFPDGDRLKACILQVTAVAIRLKIDGIPTDVTRQKDLLQDCHEIHTQICDLAGRMERSSEGADQ